MSFEERCVLEWKDLSGKLHMKILSEPSAQRYVGELAKAGAKGVSMHRLRG